VRRERLFVSTDFLVQWVQVMVVGGAGVLTVVMMVLALGEVMVSVL